MAPPFFEELGRCAYDVLRSGYNIGQFGVRTRTIPKDGFDLKTAASHNFDTERMHASLSAMHSFKPYGLILKESWSTDNKLTTEFQLRDRFAKGLVLKALNTFQPQSRKQTAAFRAEYMNDMMALNFRVDNTVSPTVCSLGAVFGYEAYLLGYETGVDLKTNALSHSHIALGYDLGNLKLHSFVKNNKEFGGTIYHRLNKDFEVGTILGWTVGSATTRFGAGFRYYLGNGATLKAKINNVSEVAICYTQSIAKGLRFVSSIGFDIKNFQKGSHQLGFGIEYDQGCCCEECPNLFTVDSCAEPTGELEFESAIHLAKSSSTLKRMRMEGFLCDIVLVANCGGDSSPEGLDENEQETRNILAHRVVLACACPYFSAMFRSKMAEAVDSKIHIRGVSADILQLLVDFMYTGKVLITEENVQSLLQAADLFGMVELCEACCNFLKSHITILNCLGIKTFAEHHNCVELAQCVREYIERHFNEIMESDEFCQQSAEYVMELFSSDHLRVPLEERVFEALIRWVRYDECNRRSVLPKLFEKVRLSHVSLFYLFNHVVKDPLVLESLECSIHVINSLRNVCLKEEGSSTCVRPRVPYCSSNGSARGVIVVGGQAPKAIRNVDFLDFKSSTWKSLRELPMRRCRCGVVCLENFVYAVGGFNGSMRVRNVDVFDVNTNTWSPLASLEARRSTLGVGQLGGRIYAIGGFDGSTGLSSAEVYDPRMKDWRFICPMSTKRSSVGVAVLNDLLFAIGGYDGDSHQCLQTVECYEPRMDRWISLVDMSCRRSGPGVVTVGDKLYVVGGHDGPQVHNSVEMFDMMQSRWMPLPDMSSCRRNAGVCAVDNVIYSMGGDDGYSNLKSVEKLEIGSAEWKVFLPSMPISRSYAGVTLVEQGL